MAEFQNSSEQFYRALIVICNTCPVKQHFIGETLSVLVLVVAMWAKTHVVQGLQPGSLLLGLLQHCQAPLV